MIGNVAVEPQATEPAICQIEADLLAQSTLGANAEAVADDQASWRRSHLIGFPVVSRLVRPRAASRPSRRSAEALTNAGFGRIAPLQGPPRDASHSGGRRPKSCPGATLP